MSGQEPNALTRSVPGRFDLFDDRFGHCERCPLASKNITVLMGINDGLCGNAVSAPNEETFGKSNHNIGRRLQSPAIAWCKCLS